MGLRGSLTNEGVGSAELVPSRRCRTAALSAPSVRARCGGSTRRRLALSEEPRQRCRVEGLAASSHNSSAAVS